MVILFLFILGATFGSFLNVLADRLPQDKSLLGRSHCESCKHTLSALDLIPLFSFLILKGKCRYCGARFSWQYFGAELLTATFFVLTWTFLGNTIVEKAIYVGIISTLIVILLADLRYQIIPDSMQVVLLLLSVALYLQQGSSLMQILLSIKDGVIIMLPLLLLFLITRGKGMGFGDVKFTFTLGFLLGIMGGLAALYISFILGGIVGTGLILFGKKKLKSKIAFGPFLIVGMITLLFFSSPIKELLSLFFSF